MSGTLTPRLGLYKPVPGGDYDLWGYQTNSNWDEVDAGVLPLTGGTMLGMLTLFGDPVAPMDAATKNYADRVWGRSVARARGRFRW
jgi:hypothetical protein